MNKYCLYLFVFFVFWVLPASAKTALPASWKPVAPDGYTPVTWAKAPGIAAFLAAVNLF